MKSWYVKNDLDCLPYEAVRSSAQEVPEAGDFLQSLYCLEEIPTAYLVGQDNLLPEESLRLFYIDENWVRCLVDGALSVGRNSSVDMKHDALLCRSVLETENAAGDVRTGFLLRSMLVQGWPDIRVSCYGQSSQGEIQLECRTLSRIGQDILWGVADGIISRIELTEPKESVGFGFVCAEEGKYILPISELPPPDGNRTVRCVSRQDCDNSVNVAVQFRKGAAEGVVDIAKLRDDVADVLYTDKEAKDKLSALEMAAEMLSTPLKYSVKGELL